MVVEIGLTAGFHKVCSLRRWLCALKEVEEHACAATALWDTVPSNIYSWTRALASCHLDYHIASSSSQVNVLLESCLSWHERLKRHKTGNVRNLLCFVEWLDFAKMYSYVHYQLHNTGKLKHASIILNHSSVIFNLASIMLNIHHSQSTAGELARKAIGSDTRCILIYTTKCHGIVYVRWVMCSLKIPKRSTWCTHSTETKTTKNLEPLHTQWSQFCSRSERRNYHSLHDQS